MKYPIFFYIGVCLALLRFGLTAGSVEPDEPPGLTVREEPNRVVMAWNGPVEPPMQQRFEDAFKKLGAQPRHILISFNSPGGRVDHGSDVIGTIVKASRVHFIDTTVGAGRLCASMCVPLYLSGMNRTAHPSARFMFHEVILKLRPEGERALRELSRLAPRADVAGIYRSAVGYHTDKLFDDEFEGKLDNGWLERMRDRIRGREVWLSARQLVEEKSGVVDKLL